MRGKYSHSIMYLLIQETSHTKRRFYLDSHSIMYLLIRDSRYSGLPSFEFTFHNVSINRRATYTVQAEQGNSHSIMYLLIEQINIGRNRLIKIHIP